MSTTPRSLADAPAVPQALIQRILDAKRVIVTAHVKPDGDAIGSVLGLVGYLKRLGMNAVATGLVNIPDYYRDLPSIDTLVPAEQIAPTPGDLLVLCDCSSRDRVHKSVHPLLDALPSICIDHHATCTQSAPDCYVDPNASAASELVWRVAQTAHWELDTPTAELIWCGVYTDTGRFAYGMTSPLTLQCAADLVAHGVDTDRIARRIYSEIPLQRLLLRNRASSSIALSPDGRIALIRLSKADYDEFHATTADSEQFVDIPRAIIGVEVAGFIYDNGPNVNLSLRTAEPHNAAEFCLRHNGGGHKPAAGATFYNTNVDTLFPLLLEELRQWIG